MKINSILPQASLYNPIANNKKVVNSVNFKMRINYGIPANLPENIQEKVLNIHKNIDFIQDFLK